MSSTDPTSKTDNGTDRSKGRSSIARAIPRNQIAVARGGGMVIVRVIGAGNMLTVPALNEFAERQLRDGYRRFVFDLQACQVPGGQQVGEMDQVDEFLIAVCVLWVVMVGDGLGDGFR